MVADFFGTLLKELGALLKTPNLQPDEHNTCLIKFKGDIFVQIEVDRSGQDLVIGSNLGTIPAGKYRDTLFAEALKANGMPPPRIGTFAYSQQANQLVLFEPMNTKDLTAAKVLERLTPFIDKVRVWKGAIAKNEVPLVTAASPSGKAAGMFGLTK